MLANIDVSGKGFKGGKALNSRVLLVYCFTNNYYYPLGNISAAPKGESIYELNMDKILGKGKLASAGGGGLDHNSGGGGGANGGNGGFGGYQVAGCGSTPFDNRGIGGASLTYNNINNKIFLGGGGGAGHCNNPNGVNMDGGNGGGIIIIQTSFIKTNNFSINDTGDNAFQCIQIPGIECNDGNGGGGGGGTVLLKVNNYLDVTNLNIKGGKGADLVQWSPSTGADWMGPGGGGGGGVLWVSQTITPANIFLNKQGGLNGVIPLDNNNPYGTTAGTTGLSLLSLIIPNDIVPFTKNIDSVRIKNSSTSCFAFDFKGLGYTNTNPLTTWQWYFGDGGTASTQNTTHTYSNGGTFNVKLIITDINGCKDSILKPVTIIPVNASTTGDTSFCSNSSVSRMIFVTGGGSYSWTPTAYLNNPSSPNPVATVSTTTKFYVTVTNSFGCSAIDSVIITINPVPLVRTIIDTATCKGVPIILTTTGATIYRWTPGRSVSDSTIANPVFTDTISRMLYVNGTNSLGCTGKDTISVTVKPLPLVKTIADTTICNTQTVTLFTNGA